MADDDGGFDEDALEEWYQRRKERDEKDAARKKIPKEQQTFADFMVDRLFERIEERATERAKDEETDEEPTRGAAKGGGLFGLMGGSSAG
jgi:hypothetical protein